MELHEAGMSEAGIVEIVGCSKGTVGNIRKTLVTQNDRHGQNGEQEAPTEDNSPFFDVCSEDVDRARAKAQALSDMTQQQEEARSLLNATVTSNVTSKDYNHPITHL